MEHHVLWFDVSVYIVGDQHRTTESYGHEMCTLTQLRAFVWKRNWGLHHNRIDYGIRPSQYPGNCKASVKLMLKSRTESTGEEQVATRDVMNARKQ